MQINRKNIQDQQFMFERTFIKINTLRALQEDFFQHIFFSQDTKYKASKSKVSKLDLRSKASLTKDNLSPFCKLVLE